MAKASNRQIDDDEENMTEEHVGFYYDNFMAVYSSALDNEFDSVEQLMEFSRSINTYTEIFQISRKFRTKVVFSCVELLDDEINPNCKASPQELMGQIKGLSKQFSVSIIAENSEILTSDNVEKKIEVISSNLPGFFEFTYMRMNEVFDQDPFTEVKKTVVAEVKKIEPTNFYEEEEMKWIEIEMTFNSEEDMQKALLELKQYMII